ncbi:hypothetical protein PPTG_07275 [Phytophthora nicotianae INRA-310]|uniref:Uncharacterized protein n=1 Tax=Phytophthora nicotianae (strain INRA-310) TaxID=761204 RepID=W2QQ35_PHYN3|nr:hypothetical protein PPTG_07275 [Phytophthora nicotianae INRA-310]ETN15071.1 hypothetical protein PPTG_07275 [Phytophthora nicotianae INRA-310]
MWDFLRRPFEDCKSYCDVLDPYYYSKTSPGVRRNPPKFDRACWENDLKYDFSLSRPPPSFQSSSSGRMQFTLSRSRSQSRSASVLHEEEEEQQVQFLFYGGSDISTPVSVGKLCSSGYRSDVICTPMRLVSQPPRISHEIPCFFSPRDTPMMSPMSAPIYSPHLFQINEQRWRLRPRHNGRYLK